MDERQESNQNQNPNTNQNTASNQAAGNSGSGGTPDVSTLLDESSLPRPVCEWIKCLRAPAMSLSISMDKQHIPNYDAEKASSSAGASGNGKSGGGSQAGGAEAGTSFSHRCTVRYFDLALGAVAVLLLSCLCKTCTGCKRAIKRWF